MPTVQVIIYTTSCVESVFAMLYDFFARDSFFFQEAPKSGAVALARAPNKFLSKNNVVCPPEIVKCDTQE